MENHTLGGFMSQALKWSLPLIFTFYGSELNHMATPHWQIQSSFLQPLPGESTLTTENYDKSVIC